MVPRKTKVGHCGTLDPLATGVLIVCVGPATRLIQFGQFADKRYEGSFRFGLASDTEDITGNVQAHPSPELTAHDVENILDEFTGTISQLPPAFSALRVNGKRAYDLARKGEDVKLEPRPVQIHEIKLTEFSWPDFRLSMRCGSGTYVRSLGRDIAARLGGSAVMTALTRTSIGQLNVTDAIELDQISKQSLSNQFLPGQSLIGDMTQTVIEDHEIAALADGQPVERKFADDTPLQKEIAGVDRQGRLIAILQPWRYDYFTPKINFSKYWKNLS